MRQRDFYGDVTVGATDVPTESQIALALACATSLVEQVATTIAGEQNNTMCRESDRQLRAAARRPFSLLGVQARTVT
jgi:hypothetical protein